MGRCFAVLLFADAITHLYGMMFGGVFREFDHSVSAPLLLLPIGWVLLTALRAPVTLERFRPKSVGMSFR